MAAPHAVVVGAGPAGALMAIRLAGLGYRVDLIERRPDPRGGPHVDDRRSINLGMSARGLRALRQVGLLGAARPLMVPMRGRAIHRPDGELTFQAYGSNNEEILYSIRRDDLITTLTGEAGSLSGVRIHFRTKVVAMERDPLRLDLCDVDTGRERSVEPDLVVGADGVFSTVRGALQRGVRANYSQEFLAWGYKELTIPSAADGSPRTPIEALHVWPSPYGLIVGHPNTDNSITGTVFLPYEGPWSFETLDTKERVRDFFRTAFPDTLSLIPDLETEFLNHPVGHLVTVRTSPWQHDGRIVLIGDAAHAVYPFYGQGMNSALEDCSILAACLERHPGDRSLALAEFERLRKPHVDVLADLSTRNFVELRDRLRSPLFAARKHADAILGRVLPDLWKPVYTLVSHTTTPYGDAVRRARRQDRILAGTALGVLGALGLAVARRVARRRT